MFKNLDDLREEDDENLLLSPLDDLLIVKK
jgi:hypothetical protein